MGIVESVRSDGRFVTIEGNTDYAGGRTGGRVMRKVRSTYNARFAMPRYAAPVPKRPTVTAPAFPLPRGYYFGPKEGPKESVSGYYSHRESLRQWQKQMISRGWNFGPDGADGLYGPATNHVVRAFEQKLGRTVNGLIGPDEWAAAWTAPR